MNTLPKIIIIFYLFLIRKEPEEKIMAKVVNIYLDSAPEKKCAIKDISKVRDLDELMEVFKKQVKMPDLDVNEYGF